MRYNWVTEFSQNLVLVHLGVFLFAHRGVVIILPRLPIEDFAASFEKCNC